MFGGGRASILFLSFMLIMVYSLMPIVFIYNLEVIITHEFSEADVKLTQLQSDSVLIAVCLLLLPVILIR